jgi:hypothetical protein
MAPFSSYAKRPGNRPRLEVEPAFHSPDPRRGNLARAISALTDHLFGFFSAALRAASSLRQRSASTALPVAS